MGEKIIEKKGKIVRGGRKGGIKVPKGSDNHQKHPVGTNREDGGRAKT